MSGMTVLCGSSAKDFLDVLTAIFPIAISLAAAAIAGAQWWNGREKNRLDLFDRRLAIFEATQTYYSALVAWKGEPDQQAARQNFLASISRAKFLFKDDSGIEAELQSLYEQSWKVTGWKEASLALIASDPLYAMQGHGPVQDILMEKYPQAVERVGELMLPYIGFSRRRSMFRSQSSR